MHILYIYPHPDDESFGPAPVMRYHARKGHAVSLLTLTKGEATKQRFKLGVSKQEMGEIRLAEMRDVARVLGLTDLTVWDMPDGDLKNLNPLHAERAIKHHVVKLNPDIIVSYDVYGISGFFDHMVTHAWVKRVYCEMRESGEAPNLKRFAMYVLDEVEEGNPYHLKAAEESEIDCEMMVDEEDADAGRKALQCYKSYMEVIKRTRRIENVGRDFYFDYFGETCDPRVSDLLDGI